MALRNCKCKQENKLRLMALRLPADISWTQDIFEDLHLDAAWGEKGTAQESCCHKNNLQHAHFRVFLQSVQLEIVLKAGLPQL